jgi:heat-inducible transcriptional repressor
MISDRKKFLLETIIKEYLQAAAPVSSGVLVEKYKLGISPATVRNEMMELEEDGYIYQPHTSSGRVPTEAAYELFLADILKKDKLKPLKEIELRTLENLFKHEEGAYKQTAKAVAELAGGAVFWAFHKNDLYYTGLSNLFSQPEFKQVDIVCDVSTVIDRLEEIIDEVFENLTEGSQVLIGSKNPFGNFLSATLLKYRNNKQQGIFGIIGPIRMDYERNLALIDFINSKFK